MGLIRAALGAVSGTLADSWKDYFCCDAFPSDVLVAKGRRRSDLRSSNKTGGSNVITNGSNIVVADGQCMIIVEQGKVTEICAEPGNYTYDSTLQPSLFTGSLGESVRNTFAEIGKRFTYGGQAATDQRIYYFNTKEITGNKYGTPSPVPYRVVDQRAGIDIDISVRCFGEYSYRIADPILFYTNVCGNVQDVYTRGQIDGQLKSEIMTALQPAFARISEQGIRYSALPGHTTEISDAMNEVLSAKWRNLRGIVIVSFGVSSIKASEEDETMIKQMQRNAAYQNQNLAAATLVGAQAQAMQDAARNSNGAAMGFMGMNMAGGAGGANAAQLFQQGAAQQSAAQAPQTAPAAGAWTCPACGAQNTGRFCGNCGAPRPAAPAALNNCPNCGAAIADPANPPRFCGNCGHQLHS